MRYPANQPPADRTYATDVRQMSDSIITYCRLGRGIISHIGDEKKRILCYYYVFFLIVEAGQHWYTAVVTGVLAWQSLGNNKPVYDHYEDNWGESVQDVFERHVSTHCHYINKVVADIEDINSLNWLNTSWAKTSICGTWPQTSPTVLCLSTKEFLMYCFYGLSILLSTDIKALTQ